MRGSAARALTAALLVAASSPASGGEDRIAAGDRAYRAGDHQVARSLWYPLAQRDDPRAQLRLGHLYASSSEIGIDAGEAFRWYRRAAEQGLADAQYEVGLRYEIGDGVAADYAEAEYWYGLATARGRCPGELDSAAGLGP